MNHSSLFLLFCLLQLSASGYTDISVSPGTLVSRDDGAGCRQHRTIVCESDPVASLTQSLYNLGRFHPVFAPGSPSASLCPNSSCWSPPPLNYQLLHETGSTKWTLFVRWETPPTNVNCSQYQVIVDRRSTVSNLTCDSISTKRSWLFGPFNNTVNHIYFNEFFSSDPDGDHQYHIKVIGSQLEYPLLVVNTPIACTQQYFTGCQNCQDDSCTTDDSPPVLNVSVTNSSSSDGLQVLVSIADSNAEEYFLHTLSLGRKMLHKLNQGTRHVYLSGVPRDNETLVWVEQFSCGCSNSSLVYMINGTNYTTITSTSHSSIMTPTPPHTPSPSQSPSSSPSSPPPTNNQPPTTSIISNTISINSNTVSINSTVSPTSSSTDSSSTPSTSSGPSIDNRNSMLILIILPVALVLLALLIVLGVIGFLLHKKRNKCVDTVCSDVPPPLNSPDSTTINNNMMKYFHSSPTAHSPSTSVISVISHDTVSDDKEAYLAYLNELVPHGADLEVYCRSLRVTPADWLQSVFKRDSIVLIVVNEEFNDEWNGHSVSDVPVVFALKQLVHSLVQQSLELKNFLIILPTPADKKHIPDYYLFHTLQRFDLQDTEGIARYIFKVPEFTVDSTC